MKVQEFAYSDIVVDPAVSARKGAPADADIDAMATSFATRQAQGLTPQIQPGVVMLRGGKNVLIAGRHRLEGVKRYNESGLNETGEEMPFYAIVVREDDQQALVTAIQENERRTQSGLTDRAETMQRLADAGKTQVQIAEIYGVTQGRVSQTLAINGLEKKYIKAIENGEIDAEAALMLGGLDTDDVKRQEIFEECVRHVTRVDDIRGRLQTKAQIEEAAAKIEAAKDKRDKLAQEAKDTEKATKEASKALEAAAKVTAKAKDVVEIEAARKLEAAAKKLKDEADKAHAAVSKKVTTAEKEIEKAKEAKTKVAEAAKAKKVDKATVAAKAAEAGVSGAGPARLTMKALLANFEAIGTETKEVNENISTLLGVIEAHIDGERSVKQLVNALVKFVKK